MCPVEQQSDPLVGTTLDGRYRVDMPIATGGMSTVYRGLDVRLDRPVALKVMDTRYSGDSHFLTRFSREAKAVARLKDPGLVAVYDQGGGGGTGHQPPFLVMELIEGGTLRELLTERGPMPPHAVAAVLAPVLGGLAVAHRAGLVHRDIKPENVLISDDGEVKIADFGLVRAVAEAKITSTSVILGTAAYLSPEQVSTGDADPRSDVYSVGILTYELLTGATPFTGDSALTVAYQRMDHDVPPPSAVIAGVPMQFDQFVRRATAREAGQRFADADEMRAALVQIVDDLGLPAFRVPAPQQSAQHLAATRVHELEDSDHPRLEAPTTVTAAPPMTPAPRPAPRQPTREITRDRHDWAPIPAGPDDGSYGDGRDDEYAYGARQFAGIEMSEFYWARQRGKRMLAFWLIAVLTLTGLVAAAAWTVGSNIATLV
ncbi:serine/threonine protein kinase [Mycobacterium sp. NS-7484]|nr:protein kinase [Mycobacterium sp. NS-7484]OMB95925.1 serine/threonine protein kinase [Mycobacterium sp. NS-7484]